MDPLQSEAPSSSGETVFNQEWNVNSPARVFANPRPLIPRAWERQARTRHTAADSSLHSDAPSNKPRVIWKRYDYHSVALKPSHGNAPDATRAVKKLKLVPNTQHSALASSYEMPSKWERRRSSLPHKSPHFSSSASSISALVSPDRSQVQSNLRVQQSELPSSEKICRIETVHRSSSETGRTSGTIHSVRESDPKSRPRLSRSSFASRRKTDFIFSRAPLVSPSRKRRLSDTLDFAQRSVAITALHIQPSEAQDESEAKSSASQQVDLFTSGQPLCLNSEPTGNVEPVESPRIAATEHVFTLQEPEEEEALPKSSPIVANHEVDESSSNEQTATNKHSSSMASPPEINSLERIESTEAENCSSNTACDVDDGNHEENSASEAPDTTAVVESVSSLPPNPSNIELAVELDQENVYSSCPSQVEGDQKASTVKIVLNDDDTDILHDFLNRAKASKAAKIAEQSSELNRRDSDIVKSALASPRKPLEELDTNSPSPRKQQQPPNSPDQILDTDNIPEKGTPYKAKDNSSPDLATEATIPEPETSVPQEQPTRRSKRNASAPAVPPRSSSHDAAPLSTISLRRQDQNDTVVLKKTETQELALLTRTNTRRNKGSAVHARFMLDKLKGLATEQTAEASEPVEPTKVRWSEKLVAYFEESNSPSLELDNVNTSGITAESLDVSKPRARRAKMLGAMNGTPAKQRTKDMNAEVLLLGDTTEEDIIGLPPIEPAHGADQSSSQVLAQTKTERKSNTLSRADEKQSESSQQQPTPRTRRRLPTPAKPVKSDTQEPNNHKTARTRQNTILEPRPTPRSSAAEDKENRNRTAALASKSQLAHQDTAVLSKSGPTSVNPGNTVGEARRRPEPAKKAATTNTESSTNSRVSSRLRR